MSFADYFGAILPALPELLRRVVVQLEMARGLVCSYDGKLCIEKANAKNALAFARFARFLV
jgi:hypothetical protein